MHPLTPISDRNKVTKLINHQENEEREEDVQAAISADLRRQISISKASWVRKWVQNMIESRDSRRLLSKQINLD